MLKLIADNAEIFATDVARNSIWHGPRHWRDVARVALMLHADGLSVDDPAPLFIFACLHDTKRFNEYSDPQHGERAAAVFMTIWEYGGFGSGIDVGLARTIATAIRDHDKGLVTADLLTGMMWDADRLTLPRVGIEPDISFISSPHVTGNFEHYVERAKQILTGSDRTWEEIAKSYERKGCQNGAQK